jgi:hypothetical protein
VEVHLNQDEPGPRRLMALVVRKRWLFAIRK